MKNIHLPIKLLKNRFMANVKERKEPRFDLLHHIFQCISIFYYIYIYIYIYIYVFNPNYSLVDNMATSGNSSFVLVLLMAAVVMMIFTAIADAFFSHCPSLCRKPNNHIFGNCIM